MSIFPHSPELIFLQETAVVAPSLPQPFVEVTASGRRARIHRALKHVLDFLPSSLTSLRGLPAYFQPPFQPSPTPIAVDASAACIPVGDEPSESPAGEPFKYVDGTANPFGLFRSYLTVPLKDPEASISLDTACDAPTLAAAKPQCPPWWSVFGRSAARRVTETHFTPFLNMTTYRLMSWFYSGSSMKSLGELNRLVDDVMMAEDFSCDELRGFGAAREAQRVDDWIDEESSTSRDFHVKDGWHEGSVNISVPCERSKCSSEDVAPLFTIPGIYYRKLVDIMKTALTSATAETFHMIPFKLWLSPPDSTSHDPALRVYSELYNSDAMIEEYEKIKTTPRSDGCQLETVIASFMLWSDSTHLAQFGNTSLWPIYAFFGNQSKYVRCKPSEFAAHHLAYIPSVSPGLPISTYHG